MSNTTYIIILITLILFSAFFSSSETAFSSLNKIKLKAMINNGNKKAEKTYILSENFSNILSTVLVGNNIVNIASATIATLFFTKLIGENKGALVSTIVMTVAVIIFGEIVPKRLAKLQPEKYAIAITPFIQLFRIIFIPFTFVFDKIGNLITSIFKTNLDDDFDSEEIITMVEEAEAEGDMDEDQADLITNAIEFNDLDVDEIFTPRVDVVCANNHDTLDDIEQKFRETGYSRLPYYVDSIDNIIGVIHEKDFYNIYYRKNENDVESILQKVIYTSENIKISKVLKQLQENKTHMAIVVDEYGGTSGIITMEDILEELVGEIYDEHDEIVEYFKKIDENKYLINCDAEIDELFEYLNLELDDERDYNTTSGWVIDNFGKIPSIGESFMYKNYNVTVTSADEKQVYEIKIEKIEEQEQNGI